MVATSASMSPDISCAVASHNHISGWFGDAFSAAYKY
jgi:hypothetical protein